MAISKRLRFEVLRRDNHACRYCGRSAPEVRLTVDHVVPVALGGQDVPENLVAACSDCNAGKSSAAPDSAIVADVAEDALRWRKAMEVANEMAARESATRDAYCAEFLDHWNTWTYPGGWESGKQKRNTFDLPGGWRTKVGELLTAGLPLSDVAEAIDLTMGQRYVKDEFSYFLGIARNKIAVRQAVAQELIRRGEV